jgi:SAM-dependent methyltransferase
MDEPGRPAKPPVAQLGLLKRGPSSNHIRRLSDHTPGMHRRQSAVQSASCMSAYYFTRMDGMGTETSVTPPPQRMIELTTGTWISQAVSVAAELGVADALADGPRPVEEIAKAVGADAPSLYRLLRALADVEVFEEREGRRFASTPLGDLLRDDAPGSLRHWAIVIGRPFHREAWTGLVDSVRTGESAFERVHGGPSWDHFRDHPEDGKIFDAAMTAVSRGFVATINDGYDFASAGTVVDVGGGQGALLAAVLAENPHLRGVLFDLPHVVADQIIDAAGVGDRCTCEGGDFFASVPAGGDVYMLASIIHDWDDDSATRILRNCRDAMNPGGRVLLGEAVLPEATQPSPVKWMDLEMLVMNVRGARQRTESEYRELFARAGLRLSGIVGKNDMFGLVEGVPDER